MGLFDKIQEIVTAYSTMMNPTEEQKAQLEAELQVAKAANDKYWADIRIKREEDTNTIQNSVVGATVIEFIPPSENDDDEDLVWLLVMVMQSMMVIMMVKTCSGR